MTALARTLILPAVLILLFAGCADETAPARGEQHDQPHVSIAEVRAWDQPRTRELPGVVRPGRRATLSTRVAGTLVSVAHSAGDQVTTGDLLARVDAREVKAAIAAAEESLVAAEAAVEQARLNRDRLQRLYQEDLIARVRFEQASVELSQLEAQRQAAQSELEAQRANLDYAELKAPFDGIVSETLVDSGSFVGPGQPLLILDARQDMRIDVPISRDQAAALHPDQSITVLAGPEHAALDARLVSVVPALTRAGTGQRLRLALDPATTVLAPGEVVTVLVPTADSQPTDQGNPWVAVPEDALIRRGQLTGVLVARVSDQPKRGSSAVIELRWITTANPAIRAANLIPVTQGLEVGERVVLNPSRDLQDNQSVVIRRVGTPRGKE